MPTTISGNTGVSQVQAGSITAADLDGAQTGDAPIFGCRAWVNFDGTKDTTGATSTANTNRLIRASGNVTSVLRNGTGDYTVTFTTAMPDANYSAAGSAANVSGIYSAITFMANSSGTTGVSNPTTSAFRFTAVAAGVGPVDSTFINVAIFR